MSSPIRMASGAAILLNMMAFAAAAEEALQRESLDTQHGPYIQAGCTFTWGAFSLGERVSKGMFAELTEPPAHFPPTTKFYSGDLNYLGYWNHPWHPGDVYEARPNGRVRYLVFSKRADMLVVYNAALQPVRRYAVCFFEKEAKP